MGLWPSNIKTGAHSKNTVSGGLRIFIYVHLSDLFHKTNVTKSFTLIYMLTSALVHIVTYTRCMIEIQKGIFELFAHMSIRQAWKSAPAVQKTVISTGSYVSL